MKVGILAGGVGPRLSEEIVVKPIPMVEIGEMQIMYNIIRNYAAYGFDEFVVRLGYKCEYKKRWIFDPARLASDLTIRPAQGTVKANGAAPEDWTVDLIETGKYQHWWPYQAFGAAYG